MLRRVVMASGRLFGRVLGRILPIPLSLKIIDMLHKRFPDIAPQSANDIMYEAERRAGGNAR